MSGRRPRGGIGLALGLAIVAAACVKREVKPPTPEETAVSESATAEETAPGVKPAPGLEPVEEATLRLKGIKLVEDEGQTGVFLKVSRTPEKIEHFTLANPNRVVIDLLGPVEAETSPIERKAVGDALVAGVRARKRGEGLRVVVDLKGATPKYAVNDLKTMVVAFLGERSGAVAPSKSQVLYAEGEALEAPAVAVAPPPPPLPPVRVAEGPPPVGPAVKAYTGQKISLDFKDADILNVLRILAEVGGENIIATDDVKGRVTVRLVDVPWDQALEIILQSNRLDSVKIGNVRRVSSVARLKEEREAQLAAEQAAKELEPLITEYISVNYMRVDKDLKEKLKAAGSERLSSKQGDGSIEIDERTNTVIVRDIRRGVDNVRDMIRRLDIQTPEVLIESNIVEGNDTFQRDLGIQWGYSFAAAPQFGNATGKQFPSSVVFGGSTGNGASSDPGVNFGFAPGTGPASQISNPPNSPAANTGPTLGIAGLPRTGIPFIADFPAKTVAPGEGSAINLALGSIDGSKALDAKLTALEKEGKGKIISRPKVVTLNNVQAKIEAVRIFRVRLPSTGTVISTGVGGVAGSSTSATEKIETGIKLEVKPQVSADGFILLEIHVKSSTADFGQQVDNIPAEISREATTNVLIKEGETVVLGGVFRDDSEGNETGLPYLRSIPFLGWLFKRMFKTYQREELLVFITPRIVRSGGTAVTSLPSAQDLWSNRRD